MTATIAALTIGLLCGAVAIVGIATWNEARQRP